MNDLMEQYREETQEYFKDSGVSRSDLDNFQISPAHFLFYRVNPKEPTPAMIFGTAYHFAILEPHLFEKYCGVLDDEVKPEPDKSWGSKRNQEAKKEFYQNNPVVLTLGERDMILYMRDKLYEKEYILDYLNDKQTEYETERYSFFKGIRLKCKIDIWNPAFDLDLKTDQSAEIDKFHRSIINKRYYFQGGMYVDIDCNCEADFNDPKPFGFIAQEKTPPYEVSLHWLNQELMSKGVLEYRYYLEHLKTCFDYNTFPGYDFWSTEIDSSFRVEPPFWFRK